jgi:hypothetical protein
VDPLGPVVVVHDQTPQPGPSPPAPALTIPNVMMTASVTPSIT